MPPNDDEPNTKRDERKVELTTATSGAFDMIVSKVLVIYDAPPCARRWSAIRAATGTRSQRLAMDITRAARVLVQLALVSLVPVELSMRTDGMVVLGDGPGGDMRISLPTPSC